MSGEANDAYNEDVTELQFLKSKPTCFIILGKPGCGKSLVAKRLSQMWRCQLLNPTEMIKKEIENSTEVGKEMNEKLMKGEALTTEYIVQFIREKINSAEISHYGYILEGLPTLDDENMSINQQLDMIKQWKFNPDFIINIKILDDDLKIRRLGIRSDPVTGKDYISRMWKNIKETKLDEDENEEDLIEDEEEEEEEEKKIKFIDPFELDFPALDSTTRERLVRIPEYFPSISNKQVDEFQLHCIPPIDDFITNHNKQNVIELDGNEAPSTLFHQLISKLESYPLRKAIVPQRLQQGNDEEEEEDEEELAEVMETDELLRTVAGYQMPAPSHRWRRSKWSRICPVALHDGQILQGKSEFSVSFLDKIYVMSSADAMSNFMKNPRQFLLPPFPQFPCKLAILGHPHSGKSALSHQLACHYDAEVVDMEILMKKVIEERREEIIKKAYQDAIPGAIKLVQSKLQEIANENKIQEEEQQINEKKNEEEENNEVGGGEQQSNDEEDSGEISTEVIQVTEDDPQVKEIAEKAGKLAASSMKIPVGEYMKILQQKLEEISAKRLQRNPHAPKQGGWILDNFPQTKEQYLAMKELNLLPDQVFVLQDLSPSHDYIRQKYYERNKTEIDSKYQQRLLQEKEKEIEQEKENMLNLQQGNLQQGNPPQPTDADEVQQQIGEPTSQLLSKLEQELDNLKNEVEFGKFPLPPDIIEFQQFHQNIEENNKKFTNIQISEEILMKIEDVSTTNIKEIFQNCITKIKKIFEFSAWEFSPQDVEEEEEDIAAMDEINIDEKEEDEDDDDEEGDDIQQDEIKRKKRKFGCSKHWDIVELHEKFVLFPGDADISAKYRDRTYLFSSDENRIKFVNNPQKYISTNKPLECPPLRLLMLGPRASGKTLHGRWLAKKLDIFHISFRDRLQEMIMAKTGRKLGAEYEEDRLLAEEMKISVEDAVEKVKKSFQPPPTVENSANEEEESGGGVVTGNDEDDDYYDGDEERFDFTPEEEIIRNYLVDDEPLTTEILDQIIPQFWKEKPYKENGFILEGFPRNADECQYLQQRGYYPDVAIALNIDEDDVTKRMLQTRLNKWQLRKKHRKEKREKIMQAKNQHRQELIEKRRTILIAEKLKENEEEEERDDEEDAEEIENQLNEEFPEEEEEEDDEAEDEVDAVERMKGEYLEQYETDTSNLESVYDQLMEIKMEKIEISASRKPSIVRYYLNNKLKNIIENRESLFEKPYPINMEYATKMLNTGYKHPSSFAYWDPVELWKGNDVFPLRDSTHPSYPVVYNQFIYFLSSSINRQLFITNPLLYTQQNCELKPVVPMQLAVVGPPKSGKTEISSRFAEKYGLVHVSIGRAIRRILNNQSHTLLAQEINKYLYQGKIVPQQLAMECVGNMLLDTKATTRGYVLDGCPVNKKQAEILRQFGIIPVQVMNLQTSCEETLKRSIEDRKNTTKNEPLHESGKMMLMKYKIICEELVAIEEFYSTNHQNWMNIETNLSKWKTWNLMNKQNLKSLQLVQDYVHKTNKGEVGRLVGLCISPSEFQQRITSSHQHYCPVELIDDDNLVDCSLQQLELAVEYNSKYYKCSSIKNLYKFIENPKKYTEGKQLPAKLPRKICADELKRKFPMKLELGGYCPVTYVDGRLRYEALKEGDERFAAEFDNHLFIFQNENKLMKFMKKPTKYTDIKLPKKLPPKKLKINTVELPVLGYLEQECTDIIIKSLNEVGCLKPKLPFLSVKKSALYYMACYLKAHNEKSSEFSRQIFKDKLKKLEDECELISYLASNMTCVFKRHRSSEFEEKMKNFLEFNQPCLTRPLQI